MPPESVDKPCSASPLTVDKPCSASLITHTVDRRELTRAAAGSCGSLQALGETVASCEACARLRRYDQEVAAQKVRRFSDWTYWGRPVPGFGDPEAHILILGLAPAAHGANRTGRMFTGDRSGDFLYAALHRAGLCNQPTATCRDDGLSLRGVYISASARCAPPGNKPTPIEVGNCRPYLLRELELLARVNVVLALGAIAHDAYLRAQRDRGVQVRPAQIPFTHGALHLLPGGPPLLDCYHVSQQNTFTGRLTPSMIDAVLLRAGEIGPSHHSNH